jgi:hypothetical protein
MSKVTKNILFMVKKIKVLEDPQKGLIKLKKLVN